MRPLAREDALPWYRQFWPWFLILLPASVVVAGLSTLFIANRHADDLVVDDYYREGLAINRQLEKKQRASALQLSASIQFGPDSVTARLSGPVDDTALRLSLSHPLEADRDFTLSLSRVGPGLYRGALEHRVAPRWHWTLESLDNRWRLDGAVQASEVSHAAGS
jgi:hypothetical protein